MISEKRIKIMYPNGEHAGGDRDARITDPLRAGGPSKSNQVIIRGLSVEVVSTRRLQVRAVPAKIGASAPAFDVPLDVETLKELAVAFRMLAMDLEAELLLRGGKMPAEAPVDG